MKLFRRKNNNEVLPDEVQDYYRTEQNNRTGMAWVLAVGGFILTAAIVVGLFFGGRWAYQSFFNDDSGVDTTTEVNDNDERSDEDEVFPGATDETDETNETDSDLEEEIDTEDTADTDTDDSTPARDEDAVLPRTGPATRE